ncbi:MAG: retroviral-like aspartic protease family protein [Bacteroidales bacterium]|jgi:hypothetical protein|nr:retroviral-like aspartic protease family protein [Bacteroidales bacterium]
MKKIAILVLLAFYTCSIFAQILTFNQGKIQQKYYLKKIPYQEVLGIPVVSVTINGKTYKFIFDTGAMLVISNKIFEELNLKVIKQINSGDASGQLAKMRLIVLPEIELHGITFQNTPGAVFPANSDAAKLAECFEIDGIIGSNMLRNSVVQFDVQNKQIIITNDIKEVLLQHNESQKMKLESWTSRPFIKITLQNGKHKAVDNVLFDTGNGDGFFTLSSKKLGGNVGDIIAETEGTFVFGSHGFYKKQRNYLLNIPEIVINNLTFNDVTVTTTNASYSIIGTKLFQYGKPTLDYRNKRFYFEPFDNINTSKPIESPWAISCSFQNDKMIVSNIWNKELESQVNLGDEVLNINEIDTHSLGFCEYFMLKISDSDKMIYELRDINSGKIKTVEIERVK